MYFIFLCLYFLWLAVQNLALPWAYRQHLLSAQVVGILMASKEAVLVAGIAVLSFRLWQKNKSWHFNLSDWFALAYIGLLSFYLLFAGWLPGTAASFSLRLISLRSLVCLALFYLWGRLSRLTIRELRHLVVFIFALHVAVSLFGLVEWLFLPTSFWSDTVGAGTFMLDIKGLLEGRNVVDGLPSNMFRFGIRRLISTYGDPLAMGIAGIFPLLIGATLLLRPKSAGSSPAAQLGWWTGAAVMAAALLLTVGRESIGAAVLGVALLLWWTGKAWRVTVPLFAILLVVALWLPEIGRYVADTITFRESSAATHLRFLQRGWEQLPDMVMGKGLGGAGGWAFSLAGVESDVGESSYFELMSQTGLFSVALLCGFLFNLALAAWRGAQKFPDPLLSAALLAAAAHVVARSVMGAFSPSLFGVVPLASFFFFCGAAFTTMQPLRSRPYLVARRVLVLRQESEPAAVVLKRTVPNSI